MKIIRERELAGMAEQREEGEVFFFERWSFVDFFFCQVTCHPSVFIYLFFCYIVLLASPLFIIFFFVALHFFKITYKAVLLFFLCCNPFTNPSLHTLSFRIRNPTIILPHLPSTFFLLPSFVPYPSTLFFFYLSTSHFF